MIGLIVPGEIIENPPVKHLYRTSEKHTVAHMSDVTVPARGARLVSKLLSRDSVDKERGASDTADPADGASKKSKKADTAPKKAGSASRKADDASKKAGARVKKAGTAVKRTNGTPKKASTTPKKASTAPKKAEDASKKADGTPKKANGTSKRAGTTLKKANGVPKKAGTVLKKADGASKRAGIALKKLVPAQRAPEDHDGEVLTETYADGLAVHASRAVFGIALVTLMLAVMWALEVIDYVTADDTSDVSKLERWGIRAHHVSDLPHIFTAPFLHAGLPHLMANSLPFLVLGFLASIRGVGKFVVMNLVVIVTSGVGIWLFGPTDAVTLGASILIFGYFGYLVGRGVFERHIVDAVMAIAVVVFYGTMVGGVLPNNPNVSWQGHLFGLLGGLISAYALRRRRVPGQAEPAKAPVRSGG